MRVGYLEVDDRRVLMHEIYVHIEVGAAVVRYRRQAAKRAESNRRGQ